MEKSFVHFTQQEQHLSRKQRFAEENTSSLKVSREDSTAGKKRISSIKRKQWFTVLNDFQSHVTSILLTIVAYDWLDCDLENGRLGAFLCWLKMVLIYWISIFFGLPMMSFCSRVPITARKRWHGLRKMFIANGTIANLSKSNLKRWLYHVGIGLLKVNQINCSIFFIPLTFSTFNRKKPQRLRSNQAKSWQLF